MSQNTPNQTSGTEHSSGKGRPTPKRRDQEESNRQPLVSDDRKAARQRDRDERERARAGMLAGEERYLTPRDRGPQKRFARDVVDSRFTVGEVTVPVLIVFILMALVPNRSISEVMTIVLWIFLVALVIDCSIVALQVRRRAAARFGGDKLEKRLGWYGAMRAMQMRMMRIPKPQTPRTIPLIGRFLHRRPRADESAPKTEDKSEE